MAAGRRFFSAEYPQYSGEYSTNEHGTDNDPIFGVDSRKNYYSRRGQPKEQGKSGTEKVSDFMLFFYMRISEDSLEYATFGADLER